MRMLMRFIKLILFVFIVLMLTSCGMRDEIYAEDLIGKSEQEIKTALKNHNLVHSNLKNLHLIFDEDKLIGLSLWEETSNYQSEEELKELVDFLVKEPQIDSIVKEEYVITCFGLANSQNEYFTLYAESIDNQLESGQVSVEIFDPSPKYEGTLENITGPVYDLRLE